MTAGRLRSTRDCHRSDGLSFPSRVRPSPALPLPSVSTGETPRYARNPFASRSGLSWSRTDATRRGVSSPLALGRCRSSHDPVWERLKSASSYCFRPQRWSSSFSGDRRRGQEWDSPSVDAAAKARQGFNTGCRTACSQGAGRRRATAGR